MLSFIRSNEQARAPEGALGSGSPSEREVELSFADAAQNDHPVLVGSTTESAPNATNTLTASWVRFSTVTVVPDPASSAAPSAEEAAVGCLLQQRAPRAAKITSELRMGAERTTRLRATKKVGISGRRVLRYAPTMAAARYRIIRFFRDQDRSRVIKTGLTLAEGNR